MNRDTQIFVASEVTISDLKQNDIFLEIDLVLCTTNPNKNKESVTEGFIDEVVAHPEIYSCLPLYCDTAELLSGHYNKLTHRQNRLNGKFYTQQIGSLLDFRKEKTEEYSSLIATARVPKREADICRHIVNMYEQGILFFSFEVAYVEADTVVEDGTRFVDASDRNYIFGMTIVSHPAYEESVTLKLVAEESDATKEIEGVEHNMDEMVNVVAEQASVEAPVEAEDTVIAEETVEAPETETPSEPAEPVASEEPAPDPSVAESDNDTEHAEAEAVPAEQTEAPAEVTAEEPVETVAEGICPVCGSPDGGCVCPEPSAEDAAIDAAHMAIEADQAALRAQIAQLEAEIEALRAEHVELEAYRAAKRAEELAARQGAARAFAEKHGLDLENEVVAKAIAEVDYEALAGLEMANTATEPVTATAAIYNVTPSIEIKNEEDTRAWLYAKHE